MDTVKAKSRWAGFLAAVGALLVLTGCYWSRYSELMETHLVLLDQYGSKLDFLARTERGVPMEEWGEFVYPLDRASDFARIAARRYPDRESLRQFRIVLGQYGALVEDPMFLSRPGGLSLLETRREALAEAIAVTRAELRREAEG